ncbi:MarR family winged helix-turn-helix transcriptional regulator [Kineococcus rhizosphaerae]|uniref:DNA-binding MarR family transcriptional regulator n=1 Tax=Kineococcus rhizosphaerae TaxID=559628 RepID=A0A2T0QZX8_9ACTN|nr:MarR family transcriptional regulator [Kineococcus rhizosphaerae]PRY12221.1 DNA-binding MarR family transcriptional regulator [Kineococcus rhizosphaerae]
MPDDTAPGPAADLSVLLGPLRRKVLRRSRELADLPDLPEAQVELLRVLAARGPSTPSQLAGTLHLARSTVSNLLRATGAAGLTERTPAVGDLRGVDVRATRAATSLLTRYDRASATTVASATARLSGREQALLPEVVSVLAHLLAVLEEQDEHERPGAP